jgi:hypothetical protein
MPPLGSRKPSKMMVTMLETCPRGEEKTNLFACIFLQRLPREIRVLLARVDHKDPKELAKQADELWALHDTKGGGGGGIAAVQQDCVEGDFVAAVRAGDRQRGGGSRGRGRSGGRGRGGTKRIVIAVMAILKVFRHQYQNLQFRSFFKPKAPEVADFLDSNWQNRVVFP